MIVEQYGIALIPSGEALAHGGTEFYDRIPSSVSELAMERVVPDSVVFLDVERRRVSGDEAGGTEVLLEEGLGSESCRRENRLIA